MTTCSFCRKFYCLLVCLGRILQPVVLLALRLFWGYFFFKAGLSKLTNISGTAESFHSLSLSWPTFDAYLVGTCELVGGIMLALGFGARLAAIPLMIITVVAYLTAHVAVFDQFWTNPEAIVKEAPFNYFLTALLVFCFGPGLFSLDAIGKKCYSRCCHKECPPNDQLNPKA